MNFNENFINGSDPSQRVHRERLFDSEGSYLRPNSENARQKEKPASSTLDRVSSTAKDPKESEQQRLQRLEREFIDRLIEDYERVVEDGLPPNAAIACMLEWASRECPRLVP
jgi:hypothetical protein